MIFFVGDQDGDAAAERVKPHSDQAMTVQQKLVADSHFVLPFLHLWGNKAFGGATTTATIQLNDMSVT